MDETDTGTGITILGATGSIGLSTLDVVSRHAGRYRVEALSANRDVDGLERLCLTHRPRFAAMADADCAGELERRLARAGTGTRVLAGPEGLVELAGMPGAELVMAAIVGAAGLMPALEAARTGKRVLLANKEALVMSGALFMDAVRAGGATLLPIDSEHNAVFQCLPERFRAGTRPPGVNRVLLTASGGPFRDTPLEALQGVTPGQACAHPNWRMGRKISVDSATMMNKGLEVIEACWLFGVGDESVEVVVHPQSVIHSMVEYADGSVLAQLGNPDMRTPIAHALAWPERIASGVDPLDIVGVGRLDFRAPEAERFPCLDLARAAWRAGGTSPAILNAANEVAVAAFLEGRLGFTAIAGVIEHALETCATHPADSLECIVADDRAARETAAAGVARFARRAAQ